MPPTSSTRRLDRQTQGRGRSASSPGGPHHMAMRQLGAAGRVSHLAILNRPASTCSSRGLRHLVRGGELVCLRETIGAMQHHRVPVELPSMTPPVFLPYVALQADRGSPDGRSLGSLGTLHSGDCHCRRAADRHATGSSPFSRETRECSHQSVWPSETHVVSQQILSGNPGRVPSLPPIAGPQPVLASTVLDSRLEPVPPARWVSFSLAVRLWGAAIWADRR